MLYGRPVAYKYRCVSYRQSVANTSFNQFGFLQTQQCRFLLENKNRNYTFTAIPTVYLYLVLV